jgi:segregation and condensation protein B
MNTLELKAIAESLLFAAGTPVSLRRMAEVVGVTQADLKPVLGLLGEEYTAEGRGVRLCEVAGGYQLRTAAECAEYVKTLVREKPNRLSRAALETLAIIAYRQPLTKAEIEVVRGVDVDGVLNSLLTKKLVRVMGRKDVPGRPWVYGTTPQFLELFGLSDLSSLPPLPDIHEPTINLYSEYDPSGAPPQASEPSGSLLAPDSGEAHPGGASAGEWGNGHAPGDDRGPTA